MFAKDKTFLGLPANNLNEFVTNLLYYNLFKSPNITVYPNIIFMSHTSGFSEFQ